MIGHSRICVCMMAEATVKNLHFTYSSVLARTHIYPSMRTVMRMTSGKREEMCKFFFPLRNRNRQHLHRVQIVNKHV